MRKYLFVTCFYIINTGELTLKPVLQSKEHKITVWE